MLGYFLMPHPPIAIPEVGRGKEKEIGRTLNAYDNAAKRIARYKPETIIIITPHGTVFKDAVSMITARKISGDLSQFGAGEVKFNYEIDTRLTEKIIEEAQKEKVMVAGINESSAKLYKLDLALDHGAMVPLYFVRQYGKYKLVHITYGMISPLDLVRFGRAVKKAVAVTNTKAVFIASGDLSHRLTKDGPYPYTPLGKKFDHEIVSILENGELTELFNMDNHLINEAAQCGLRSLYVMAGAMDSARVQGDLLNYEGPFGVGYAVMEFTGEGAGLHDHLVSLREKENRRRLRAGNPYTKLARRNLNSYFNTGQTLEIGNVTDKQLLNDRKGVFVSLKINGELRGCIGTIEPHTSSIAQEIINNSLSAALNDPRFAPLSKEEFLEVDLSVDLLYPPEKTTFDQLNPKEYGVIVTSGRKKGLLLPNLEGVDTKEQQVEIAMSKGNIDIGEKYSLERFKVERFSEVEEDE